MADFPPPPPEARRLPSGLNATDQTESVCPSKTRISAPLDTSQTRTVLSTPPEARRLPSGLNSTDQTEPVCPLRIEIGTPISAPLPTSQTRTVPSSPPEARRLPSGLNATEFTELLRLIPATRASQSSQASPSGIRGGELGAARARVEIRRRGITKSTKSIGRQSIRRPGIRRPGIRCPGHDRAPRLAPGNEGNQGLVELSRSQAGAREQTKISSLLKKICVSVFDINKHNLLKYD
uniref:Uncharacterized protein n=1 Tax=Candidatus Kentrum sp. LFY TaxID=2126342 RepID=A0A450WNY3_9GAMM|nr:MAG: hypothetical protein BECKLFY1418C_GA0070996_10471 [Candidatus Kentron sp. LFY]